MEVILLENVSGLGRLGDKVNVKPGYGRNFLMPQGKAQAATEENLKLFEARRAELEAKEAAERATAEKRLEALNGKEVSIPAKAGAEGKLFGSIGTREISEAISAGIIEVEKREINLPEGTLRQLGEFAVTLSLYEGIEAQVTIKVVEEEA